MIHTETWKTEEKAILVGTGEKYAGAAEDQRERYLDELALLTDTAGARVVGTIVQARATIDPASYLGSGKVQELLELVEETHATSVIFDVDLTPAQVSNLQKTLDRKIIDRSGLILDIFALRAKTRAARTQVELAQLKYLLPRLTRQWTHLSRQVGGIGTRGPGETQLEVDRRRVRERIDNLSRVLKTIGKQRSVARKQRAGRFKVSLIGYTNAGKSTMLNALSGADVPVENKLFKTLDSVTRMVQYPDMPVILVSDTVGFIRDLPHDLIVSFESTLDEVRDADLLLHVIDITNPEWQHQMDVVNGVLADMKVTDTDMLCVFNKVDGLDNPDIMEGLRKRFQRSVFVSAQTGEGVEELIQELKRSATSGYVTITRSFGPDDGFLLSEIHRLGIIHETTPDGDSFEVTFSLPIPHAERLSIMPEH